MLLLGVEDRLPDELLNIPDETLELLLAGVEYRTELLEGVITLLCTLFTEELLLTALLLVWLEL